MSKKEMIIEILNSCKFNKSKEKMVDACVKRKSKEQVETIYGYYSKHKDNNTKEGECSRALCVGLIIS